MPMVIMSAAAAIWLIWGPQRTRTFWPRGSSVAISTICIFGCLTSLLVMSIYQMEMKRVYLLADLIVQNTISDSFHPDGNPDLKAIWPSSNYDPQDALDRALDARGYKRVVLHPTKYEARYVEHGRAALELLYTYRNGWRQTLIPLHRCEARDWKRERQRIHRTGCRLAPWRAARAPKSRSGKQPKTRSLDKAKPLAKAVSIDIAHTRFIYRL
jgi:hypothetical protein